MKRKLSDEEKKYCEKGLLINEEELDWISYQLEYCELMLNKGIEQNYLKSLREFKVKKKEWEEEKKMAQSKIDVLCDQIKNGVEIKDIKEVKK